ncbi:MAG: caspase family protein [Pseudomonadota bacterium]
MAARAIALLLAGVAATQLPASTAGVTVLAAAPAPDSAAALRALPRASRHALIIGVGHYLNPSIPELRGIGYDIESATSMALAMQVPKENIRVLRDAEATAADIEREIADLNKRTQPGDRVFFYFSGHGSRWYDAAVNKNGCVEALLPADGLPLTNERIATILKPISDKTDKLFVFYDACHSGGIVDRPLATMRSLKPAAGGTLTPKFSSVGTNELCSRPTNMKTRAFTTEAIRTGGLPQNIVQISSSRPDEVSFDDEGAGGLATQAWRDCMLGGSHDLDNSGGISVSEIAACAQTRIDKRFANSSQFAAQHVTIGGNQAFIPSWFSGAFATAPATAAAALKPVAAVAATAAAPDAAFADILAQRDPRRSVTIGAAARTLKIGRDTLDLTVTSSHAGHLYLVLLGSDNESFYLLFPNDKDHNNTIKAGETLRLPRPDWKITAQGPAGTDRMLAVVTESPRNLSLLGSARSGPFLQALTDSHGRANLSWILSTAMHQASAECKGGGKARSDGTVSKCSDAFGAAMTSIIEN